MYSDSERQTLLDMARKTITLGSQGLPLEEVFPQVECQNPPVSFEEVRACFVSLHQGGELRGCIGSLEPHQKLKNDVIANAWSAAFRDPRFSPVTENEVDKLELEISVLSPVEPFPVKDEQDLLHKLQPHHDGLIIDDGHGHRATFLPQVWEKLPQPQTFLAHLKRKAGLGHDEWPESLKCFRYHCEAFSEQY